MQGHCSVSQACRGNAGDPDINCHRLHVEAVKSHAVSVSAEVFIAPGSAIAADYIDFEIRIAERGSEIVQQIEYPRIVRAYIAGAMIAQIVVQAVKGFLIISMAIAVDDIEPLACMRMEKPQLVRAVRRSRAACLCDGGAHNSARSGPSK